MESRNNNYNDFISAIQLGQEIEFRFLGNKYFLQPFYGDCGFQKSGSIPKYVIYDCNSATPNMLFCGTREEILNYTFQNGKSLKKHFQYVTIDYVL